MRRYWVNFPCQGVLLIWIIVGQGPIALAVGAGGGVWTFFLPSIFSLSFLPLWETARYRLKYCLKGQLNPKNQPTNLLLKSQIADWSKLSYAAEIKLVRMVVVTWPSWPSHPYKIKMLKTLQNRIAHALKVGVQHLDILLIRAQVFKASSA